MFRAEYYKLLGKQKGFIVLFFFLVLKIVFTLLGGYESNYIIDRNPDGYTKYINLYKGKLTETKGKAIEAEANKINNVRWKLDSLLNEKNEGKISKIEYERKVIQSYEREKNTRVFRIVYNQYFYVKEAPTERYIMDERGWNTLLASGNLDFFLIFSLILILTPLFCNEYESGMEALLLSTRKGKYQAGCVKLLSGSFLAVGITVLFSLVELVIMDQIIGLNGGLYPLQSLRYYENSIYHGSILEAYIFVVACRSLGAIFLVGITSLIGVLYRKSIIVLFTCSIFVFLPNSLLKGHHALYYLPLPTGLLMGQGYLRGTSHITEWKQDGTTESVVQFMQINKSMLVILIMGHILLISALMLYSLKKYSRSDLKIRRIIKKFKISKMILSILFMCILFSGCTLKEKNNDSFTACASESLYYGETSKYNIHFDIAQQTIIAENKKNGEKISLIRDPLVEDIYIHGIFVRSGWCYYLEKVMSKQGYRIYGIDLTKFSRILIYNSITENTEDFFGIISNNYSPKESLEAIMAYKGFFVDNNYIYCIDMMDNIMQVNRNTKLEKVIAIDAKGVVYFCNGDLYYSDSQNRLCVFKKKDGLVHHIDSIYTKDYKIEKDQIVYKNILNDNKNEYYDILLDNQ